MAVIEPNEIYFIRVTTVRRTTKSSDVLVRSDNGIVFNVPRSALTSAYRKLSQIAEENKILRGNKNVNRSIQER